MINFDANEIVRWADMPDAFHKFPTLLGKLILATTPATSFIDMPGGRPVWLPGWDGLIEIDCANPWIPSGKSAWEFGTGDDPQRKADEDYNKRTLEPLGVGTEAATFVFVTPRVWSGKRNWIEQRREEGKWADVRAYDATDLVLWLGEAPGVGDWFARLIRKLPDAGFTCVDYWWENWASVTQPDIAPELVLAGRSEQVEAVRNWIEESPNSFYVQGDTRDEAVAFLAASALGGGDKYGPSLMSRALVVKTPEAWHGLVHSNFPMVLIREFEGDVSSRIAIKNGHHVVLPLDRAQEPRGSGRRLPKLGRDETIEALQSMGKSESQARALSRKSARRLPVMRRRLLEEAGAPPPEWASPTPLRSLTALVLIGQWSEEKEGDKEIVAEIAGKSYQEVEQELTPLLNISDAPLTKIGERWRYVSHEEAWHILAPYLTSTDVERFEEIAVRILSRKHPKFDLPTDERWYASIKGKDLPFSGTLVEGVARCMALMGTQPERVKNVQSAQYIPDRIVRHVLGDGSDWRTWATLSGQLATLAESAPDAFLNAVERTIDTNPIVFKELFDQDKDPMFSGSPHTGLLWGLERLAWSKDYFPRVAIVLAKLAEIDPGGQTSNRPARSVGSLFHWMCRFTEASDQERIEVLTALLKRHPKIGWDVVTGNLLADGVLLRNLLDSTEWREWGQDGYTRASPEEVMEFRCSLARLASENITADVEQWTRLLKTLSAIQGDARQGLLKKLEGMVGKIKRDANAETLRTAIRSELDRHRSYPNEWWSMPPDDVDYLSAIYDKLTPSDPVAANAWLFNSDWPDFPDGKVLDYEEKRERIEAEQRKAIVAIFKSGGLDAIERLLDTVNYPHIVGASVAVHIDTDEVFPLALICIKSDYQNRKDFATTFLNRVCHESGWAVLDKAIDALKSEGEAKPETLASIYISGTPVDLKTCLQRLDSESKVVQDAYWSNVNWFNLAGSETERQDRLTAIQRLLDAGRSITVAELTWRMEVPVEIVLQTLEQIPADWANGTDSSSRDLSYRVSQLFKRLDKCDDVSDEVIAHLEMPYIGMLENHRPNLALHREVLRQPSLFADLITFFASVRLDGRYYDETLNDEIRDRQISFAFNVLSKLHGLPGIMQDGTLDAETLEAWVSESRRLCAERERAEIGDEKIGEILANSPVGEDGVWPCEPVRDLLDALSSSEHIGNGFTTGRFNQRGFTSRGLYDGGAQERELVAVYDKDAALIAARWPFTAGLLRQLAQRYKVDARREDTRAQWTDETYG